MASWHPSLAVGAMSAHDISLLLLTLGLLLGLARVLGEVARRFKQPAVLGEILAGILLGPTVLGAVSPDLYQTLFPQFLLDAAGQIVVNAAGAQVHHPAFVGLQTIITVAAVLLLLIAGLEVDLATAVRQGKAALLVSITGIVFPFAAGFTLGWFGSGLLAMPRDDLRLPFALFIGIALSITALPVIAKILMDLSMAKSDIGILVMASAMVDDLLGWIGFALVLAMIPAAGGSADSGAHLTTTIALTFAFIGLMLTVGRAVNHKLLPYIQAHGSWPGAVLGYVLTVAFLCAAATESIGIHAIFGAFIAGAAIGDSRHLRERTRETIHHFINYVFAPLFFATIGLRVSFSEAFDPVLVLVVLVIAILGKAGGCFLGAKWAGFSVRESWAVGFGMSARGAMEIILGQLALSYGLIGERLFVAIVIMALVTSIMAGPIMEKLLQRKLRKRLHELLADKHIVLGLHAATPEEAIRELAQRAQKITDIDADWIAQKVIERERIASTGIGNAVAVPHARLAELDDSLIIIGRDEGGLDFNAPDGEPARLICLLLTPQDDATAQIELLAEVARVFSDAPTRVRALEAESTTEFRAALNVAQTGESA
jgi:Kef-type K+ transport system membrane component KefB/mannitol/fructose-specific phosphotransferase system IIA component (Ntr-type)